MFTLIRIAISLILIFISTQVLANEDECTQEFIDAVHVKCDNAQTTMQVLDRNIASIGQAQGAEGINDGAVVQSDAIGKELQSFPMIAEGCQAIASDCVKKCSKYPEACAKPKIQAASMAMQLGSMQTAFAKTQQVDQASEVQVAQAPPKRLIFQDKLDPHRQMTFQLKGFTESEAISEMNGYGGRSWFCVSGCTSTNRK